MDGKTSPDPRPLIRETRHEPSELDLPVAFWYLTRIISGGWSEDSLWSCPRFVCLHYRYRMVARRLRDDCNSSQVRSLISSTLNRLLRQLATSQSHSRFERKYTSHDKSTRSPDTCLYQVMDHGWIFSVWSHGLHPPWQILSADDWRKGKRSPNNNVVFCPAGG